MRIGPLAESILIFVRLVLQRHLFCGDILVFFVMGKYLKLSAVKKFFRHLVWLWRLIWQSKPATIRNRFEPRGNICWKFKFRNVSRKQQSSLGLQSPRWSFSTRVCYAWVQTFFLFTFPWTPERKTSSRLHQLCKKRQTYKTTTLVLALFHRDLELSPCWTQKKQPTRKLQM